MALDALSQSVEDTVALKGRMPYDRGVMSDQDIQLLESQFPAVSGQAFAAARERVLASGQSVLQSEGSFVYRVFPDGSKEVVKQIEPPTPMKPGTIYTIR